MTVTVLLFAALADRAGARRLEMPHRPGDTVGTVRDRLIACHPLLEPFMSTVLFALNEEYVKASAEVSPGDTLALIPPVSGG